MKINFFALNNFRGISGGLEENKIIFEDTNTLFLYGQNNVGKSSFLKAYQHFYKDEKPVKEDFYKSNFNNEIEFEIEVFLQQADKIRIEAAAPRQKESYKKYLHNDRLRIKKTWTLDGRAVKAKNQTYDFANESYEDIGYATIGLHSVFQSCLQYYERQNGDRNESSIGTWCWILYSYSGGMFGAICYYSQLCISF